MLEGPEMRHVSFEEMLDILMHDNNTLVTCGGVGKEGYPLFPSPLYIEFVTPTGMKPQRTHA